MRAKNWWKRPLTYLLLPAVIVLVMAGVLPPFPPSRPVKAPEEHSEPADKARE